MVRVLVLEFDELKLPLLTLLALVSKVPLVNVIDLVLATVKLSAH
jgi:hypothetical protein